MVMFWVVVRQKTKPDIQERYKHVTAAQICSLSEVLYCNKYVANKNIQMHYACTSY